MKANELRIGNYVTLVGGSDLIHAYKIDVISPLTDEGLDDIKPIPLTEEILLKCGFEKDADGAFFKGFVSLFLDKRFRNNIFLKENDTEKWVGINCKIKHLHQLQNLYFALTGEELNIEL